MPSSAIDLHRNLLSNEKRFKNLPLPFLFWVSGFNLGLATFIFTGLISVQVQCCIKIVVQVRFGFASVNF